MKIFSNNFKIFIFTFTSMLLGVFLWDKINLPYSNPENIYGVLSINKFSPHNNDLRFLAFISLVFGTFFLSLIFYKRNLNNFNEIFFFKKKKESIENYKYLNITFLIFLTLITFEFLSISFPLNLLDFYHEGEWLSPAKNYLLTGKIWSGAYFVHGGFFDVFNPVIAWKIFGNETIGSSRLFIFILIYFTKVFSLVLTFKIAKLIKSNEITKIIYFALIAISILALSEYQFGHSRSYIRYTDLPILIFSIFSMEIILKSNKNHYGFLIGLISSISIVFSVDRGIYINVIILFLLVYFLLRKEFQIVIFILLGLFLSWAIFYIIIGSKEFSYFLKNSYQYAILFKGFMDSYIYPTPFIPGTGCGLAEANCFQNLRATKGILTIIISGLLIIYSLLIKNEKKDYSLVFYFFIIFLFALLTYKNALGRSDAAHIRHSMSFSIFLICLIFFKNISFKISQKLNFHNINLIFVTGLSVILLSSTLIINSIYFKGKHSPKSVDNLINIKYRLKEYVKLSDKNFLHYKLLPVIEYYKKISDDDNCVQTYTNEPAWAYLTKKRMCTQFHAVWFATPDKLQKEFINEFSGSNAQYILMDAPRANAEKYQPYGGAGKLLIDGLSYEKRYALIDQYLKKNFKFHKNINGWIFYKKNN
jgi:hypothetical protein